jgi:hypothetical protein
MSERYVRCGEEGEDRRTLRMACFYAMDELNVPFVSERDAAMSRMAQQIGTLNAANSGLKKAVLIGSGVSLVAGVLLGAWIVSR